MVSTDWNVLCRGSILSEKDEEMRQKNKQKQLQKKLQKILKIFVIFLETFDI